MFKTDREIVDAVACELKWDTRVHKEDIEVRVDGGAVILLGSVGSWAARLAAQSAAQRVGGVREVINRIEVELPPEARRSDAELGRAVRSALESDAFVQHRDIRSSVSAGQVILEGEVQCCTQRDDAERAVRNIRGVRCVLNQIMVRPSFVEAYLVQQSIESALERRREGQTRAVNLDVHDGKVILSGAVRSWAERQSIVDTVRGTRGVRSVDDRMYIETR